jgi:hypothetical protein
MISFNALGNYGHLGNQMFQYATTVSVAKHMNTEACCPLYGPSNCRSRIADCFKLGGVQDQYLQQGYLYREPSFRYDENIFNLDSKNDWNLHGYFQSEKYFKNNREGILNEFTFKDDRLSPVESLHKTSLHVRRTDYLPLSDIHTTLSTEYWEKAFDILKPECIIVFSDDVDWCREVFVGDQFVFSTSNDPYVDMCMMTQCQQHIMANSTFSWWASWLTGNKSVAPKNWFGPKAEYDCSDLFCDDWVLL